MSRAVREGGLVLGFLLGLACAGVEPAPEVARAEAPADAAAPEPPASEPALAELPPAERPGPALEAAVRRRVEGFYLRLAHRRFNTVETYNDRIMREHFQDAALFLDYYADLAQAFADAHFEKRRPLAVEVRDIAFEGPDVALVEVQYLGDDRRPLRPGRVELVRTDRWVLRDRIWWIQPGKL